MERKQIVTAGGTKLVVLPIHCYWLVLCLFAIVLGNIGISTTNQRPYAVRSTLYKETWLLVTSLLLALLLSSFEKATRNWRRIQLFGSETGIAPKTLTNSFLQNSTMAQSISDVEMAANLADMADSQVPALSPIKSSKRPRDCDSPVNEIPATEPASKKHKADEGSKSIRNRLTTLETRRAKCKRSLQVLREHAKNLTCPYGLQYIPKPHIRFDQEFQTPWPRSVTEPIWSCLPLWSNSRKRI